MHKIVVAAGFVTLPLHYALAAQPNLSAPLAIQSAIYKPQKLDATHARVKALKVPAGFRVSKFAEGLDKPRMMAVADDGTVYVTRREPGDLLALKDADGDGKADTKRTVATREQLHGVALRDKRIYLVSVNEVYVADVNADGAVGELTTLAKDLPDGGQHPNKTLAFGPDGMLYVSAGSTCNACNEPNKEAATMLRFAADLKSRKTFAEGLRNTIGFDWHPQTKALWGADHGIDWLSDTTPEELNLLQEGRHYGWPHVFGKKQFNPQYYGVDLPPELTKEQALTRAESPTLELDAHSAPMALKFYAGTQFPSAYRDSAFVALHGSWNRKEPSGYKVVRVEFRDGKPIRVVDFLSGFLVQGKRGYFGRPVGLAVAKDGSLLVSDDANGVIYRVSYDGTKAQSK